MTEEEVQDTADERFVKRMFTQVLAFFAVMLGFSPSDIPEQKTEVKK
jgi:hypothetical protein